MEESVLLHEILDNSENIVYVADVNTYEILYLNLPGKQMYNLTDDNYKGRKCYKLLQKKDSPCEFCTNEIICKQGMHHWEYYNEILKKHFAITDRLFEFEGKQLRLEVAVDNTDDVTQKQNLGVKIIRDETLLKCIRTLSETNDLKKAINQLLAIVCNYYAGDRGYIFEIDYEKEITNNTYEWCADGVTKEIGHLQNISLDNVEAWISCFEKYGIFFISSISKDIDEDTEAYEILDAQGIKSLIAAPLIADGKISGFIGVDNPENNTEDYDLLLSITYFIINDIQKRQMISSLEHSSYVDVLTGIYNRNKYVIDLMNYEKEKYFSTGVIYIDLNGLKVVNDRYGHDEGDVLIKKIAKIMNVIFPWNVYRIGGDEFVVIYKNSSKQEFKEKVNLLRSKISVDQEISVSIGVAWEENNNIDVKALVRHADDLMYANKQIHYNSVYKEYNRHSSLAKQVLDDIRFGRYSIYLQPKIELPSLNMTSAEALIRRVDEQGNIVVPDKFIPVYEAEGVIRHIDFYVLETVCKMLQRLDRNQKSLESVSINFSRATLLEFDVVEHILSICNKYSISPKRIVLEMTESVSKLKTEEVVALSNKIKDAGFYLSLDDYGAKYSNIAIMSNVDFDEIKLDRSIISELTTNEKARTIVRYTINMCKGFKNTITIAEGVETKEQLELLNSYGCDVVQGYYFSRPLPMKEFLQKYQLEK